MALVWGIIFVDERVVCEKCDVYTLMIILQVNNQGESFLIPMIFVVQEYKDCTPSQRVSGVLTG